MKEVIFIEDVQSRKIVVEDDASHVEIIQSIKIDFENWHLYPNGRIEKDRFEIKPFVINTPSGKSKTYYIACSDEAEEFFSL